ncbi:hypothetical protein DSO57_1009529 [Entomophthora muscae]|uniref:Uncharacterized protein n=1 Tax=Entomophthora muscae TaxID=34485 RepID=A0ACC2RLI7_9FUNG|nr:hypothetical protein DSO57_1009529 [Entomophthora muscae]
MEQHPNNNFTGRYNGQGNYRGRGNHYTSGQSHYNGYNNQRGQYRGRGRGRGGRHLNSNNYSTLHARSFEEILEAMTGEDVEEHQVPSKFDQEKIEANTAPKSNREDELDEDVVYKYSSLIKIDTPEELARWIEKSKKELSYQSKH